MTIWRNEQLHIVARLPRSSSAYEAENIQLADMWRVSNRSWVAHGPALPSRANYRKPWSGHPDDIFGTRRVSFFRSHPGGQMHEHRLVALTCRIGTPALTRSV